MIGLDGITNDEASQPDPSDTRTEKDNLSHSACARVLLIDPTPVTRLSLAYTLGSRSPDFTLDSSGKAEGHGRRPDLVLVNIKSLRITDLETLKQIAAIRQWSADSPIAVISELDEMSLAAFAVQRDIRGYIPTSLSSDIAIAAIELMLTGGVFLPEQVISHWSRRADDVDARQAAISRSDDNPRLTLREKQILGQLRRGNPNKIIAYELGISESTVKVHIRNVMKKFGASNRTQVAVLRTGHSIDGELRKQGAAG